MYYCSILQSIVHTDIHVSSTLSCYLDKQWQRTTSTMSCLIMRKTRSLREPPRAPLLPARRRSKAPMCPSTALGSETSCSNLSCSGPSLTVVLSIHQKVKSCTVAYFVGSLLLCINLLMFYLNSVQHECIPQAILGMDILCQAKSGMGKTAVFVLATLQQIEPVDGQVSALFSIDPLKYI